MSIWGSSDRGTCRNSSAVESRLSLFRDSHEEHGLADEVGVVGLGAEPADLGRLCISFVLLRSSACFGLPASGQAHRMPFFTQLTHCGVSSLHLLRLILHPIHPVRFRLGLVVESIILLNHRQLFWALKKTEEGVISMSHSRPPRAYRTQLLTTGCLDRLARVSSAQWRSPANRGTG